MQYLINKHDMPASNFYRMVQRGKSYRKDSINAFKLSANSASSSRSGTVCKYREYWE